MVTPSLHPAVHADSDQVISLESLIRPFFHRRRLIASLLIVAWIGGLAVTLLPARRYKASYVLAVIPNAGAASSIGGSIGALLGTGQLGGLQSTPYFITRLLLLRSVIMSVAMSPMTGQSDLVIERVMGARLKDIKPTDIEPAMRSLLETEVDKQTGLITFSVTHRDSALVRQVATQIVNAASETYIDVGRAQAKSQRIAEQTRVDSAERQLHRAEQDLLDFLSSNRSFAPYSVAAVTQQRLQRKLDNAQTVYSQAITDREAAVAQELEATPAVVVVDSIPRRLLPESRHGVLKLILATVLALAAATLIMLLRGDFTTVQLLGNGDVPAQRHT
jgi:uncharacterized protein involved in exopolysaccharide biosynthesis